jgi:3-phosphoshikimate 1-carboxyvinyltransferase
VRGGPLEGVDHELEVASAQVKSALLLAGLRATGTTSVREPWRSRDHTERLLRYLGVPIEESSDRLIVKSTDLQSAEFVVPGDLSSAAFLLVAAAIVPGSSVSVHDVGVNPTRAGILQILGSFGAEVAVDDRRDECGEPVGTVTVRAGDRRPVRVEGGLTVASIDELPLVAVLGAMAEGETVVADAAELRVKESDRIGAMVEGFRAMGVDIEGTLDGFVVRGRGGRFAGARIDPRGDHRIAMAFAVAGLAATEGETVVDDWGCVGVSYPEFERDLERLAVR